MSVAPSEPFSKLPITNGDSLNVESGMRLFPVVDFDPITADVAPGTSWHPYHALSALCIITCLGAWLEIEIQLSRLMRLRLRVHDRRFERAIHEQCYPVNARLQSLRNITALCIGLDCAEHLFAVSRFDLNVCAFNRFAYGSFDKPLNGCWPLRCNFVRSHTGFQFARTHTGSDSRRWRPRRRVCCNFVCSQTGFQCAITHTGSQLRLWRRSALASVRMARVETARRCVIRNCGWIEWIL